MEQWKTDISGRLEQSEKVLIGIGQEWVSYEDCERNELYRSLAARFSGLDYFIVTMLTDGEIFESELPAERIVAPCGNQKWRQCSKACTKDVWEEHEVIDGNCVHCGQPLVVNTIAAANYIEEGYQPAWSAYLNWLTNTLNKTLTVYELGVGFDQPTVIRWPFEKTVFFNQKSVLYRVNQEFYQIPAEIEKRAVGVAANSLKWFVDLLEMIC